MRICLPGFWIFTRRQLDKQKILKHIGFSDAKYMIPLKSMVGKLSPDVAHDEICKIHLEFFDTYLKKMKNRPSFADNDEVTFTEYAPLV